MNQFVLRQILDTGVVAILRGVEQNNLQGTLKALYQGGIRAVEITMNTPGSLHMIEQARELYDGKMAVGAGTVLDGISARSAILAGANFVLAPTLWRPTIETCLTYGCVAIPGAFSPTEVLEAWKAGAQIVKVFPCGSVGPSYIKDLRGPLPQINMMPVGGITLETTPAFFSAGACAVGVGSSLFDPVLAREHRFDELQNRARSFIELSGKH